MRIEWVTDWDQIWSDNFQKSWHKWMEESENVHIFFHPAMVKVWFDTYLPIRNVKPLFCLAHTENNTVFFPMVLWKQNWKNAYIRSVIPVGYSDFDYHDPIVTGDNSINWEEFWEALIRDLKVKWGDHFDIINIDGIRKDCIGVSEQWLEAEVCPYINLSEFTNTDAFLKSLKRNLRQDIKRRVRRLEENPDVKFEVFQRNELKAALNTLPELLKYHSLRWPNAYKAPQYHENLIRTLLPLGLMHFSRILINGQTISWRIGFVYRSRYYSYMPAFDTAFKQYSPGKVHLLYCIDDAINKGVEIYDQLRGAELYKNEWTKTLDTVYSYSNLNDLWFSKAKMALIGLKHSIKR